MTNCLILSPRDGLFLKDGRGWFTSSSGRAEVLDWPFVTTVRGAVRTAVGRAIESGRSALEPDEWLALTADVGIDAMLPLRRTDEADWAAGHRMWPVPADALYLDAAAEVTRLDPRPRAPDVRSLATARPDDPGDEARAIEALWWPEVRDQGKPEPRPRWWDDNCFLAWLTGGSVRKRPLEERRRDAMAQRMQVHVRIDPFTQGAVDSALFASRVVEPLRVVRDGGFARHEWSIALRCTGVEPDLDGAVLTLGGDRRLVLARAPRSDPFVAPKRLLDEIEAQAPRGLRLVVVAPAHFTRGWRPDWAVAADGSLRGAIAGLDELVLRAAFVDRPQHVSGWDMALGRPKPTLRLVPAGAVYFVQKASGAAFTRADAEALWLHRVGEPGATDQPAESFGQIVPGVWHPPPDASGERP